MGRGDSGCLYSGAGVAFDTASSGLGIPQLDTGLPPKI